MPRDFFLVLSLAPFFLVLILGNKSKWFMVDQKDVNQSINNYYPHVTFTSRAPRAVEKTVTVDGLIVTFIIRFSMGKGHSCTYAKHNVRDIFVANP